MPAVHVCNAEVVAHHNGIVSATWRTFTDASHVMPSCTVNGLFCAVLFQVQYLTKQVSFLKAVEVAALSARLPVWRLNKYHNFLASVRSIKKGCRIAQLELMILLPFSVANCIVFKHGALLHAVMLSAALLHAKS